MTFNNNKENNKKFYKRIYKSFNNTKTNVSILTKDEESKTTNIRYFHSNDNVLWLYRDKSKNSNSYIFGIENRDFFDNEDNFTILNPLKPVLILNINLNSLNNSNMLFEENNGDLIAGLVVDLLTEPLIQNLNNLGFNTSKYSKENKHFVRFFNINNIDESIKLIENLLKHVSIENTESKLKILNVKSSGDYNKISKNLFAKKPVKKNKKKIEDFILKWESGQKSIADNKKILKEENNSKSKNKKVDKENKFINSPNKSNVVKTFKNETENSNKDIFINNVDDLKKEFIKNKDKISNMSFNVIIAGCEESFDIVTLNDNYVIFEKQIDNDKIYSSFMHNNRNNLDRVIFNHIDGGDLVSSNDLKRAALNKKQFLMNNYLRVNDNSKFEIKGVGDKSVKLEKFIKFHDMSTDVKSNSLEMSIRDLIINKANLLTYSDFLDYCILNKRNIMKKPLNIDIYGENWDFEIISLSKNNIQFRKSISYNEIFNSSLKGKNTLGSKLINLLNNVKLSNIENYNLYLENINLKENLHNLEKENKILKNKLNEVANKLKKL